MIWKCISNKKRETHSCQMSLRQNVSPRRGHLVTPNQPKFFVPRDCQIMLSHGKGLRAKITDASPAVLHDLRLTKVSNSELNSCGFNSLLQYISGLWDIQFRFLKTSEILAAP